MQSILPDQYEIEKQFNGYPFYFTSPTIGVYYMDVTNASNHVGTNVHNGILILHITVEEA